MKNIEFISKEIKKHKKINNVKYAPNSVEGLLYAGYIKNLELIKKDLEILQILKEHLTIKDFGDNVIGLFLKNNMCIKNKDLLKGSISKNSIDLLEVVEWLERNKKEVQNGSNY